MYAAIEPLAMNMACVCRADCWCWQQPLQASQQTLPQIREGAPRSQNASRGGLLRKQDVVQCNTFAQKI